MRGKQIKLPSLDPLAKLKNLEILWLLSVQVMEGGWVPLHSLRKLASLRATMQVKDSDFESLRRPYLRCDILDE